MKVMSFSALVILVAVAIAALAQEPQNSVGHAGVPPNGYVSFAGLPSPTAFAAAIR